MLVLGIDEVARGSVIGPLLVCGLAIHDGNEKKLKEIRVKDSKMLSPKKREELYLQIEQIASHIVIMSIPACRIDALRRSGINLNQIEALKMADIINMVQPNKAIIDTPSHNSHKFRDFLWSKLENKNIELVCENFADKNYPVVSAASIIAKVERDRKIERLKKKVGFDFGVGYSHDQRTIKFLKMLVEKNNGKMPTYVRHTWDTVEEIVKPYKQSKLLGFLGKFKKKEKC